MALQEILRLVWINLLENKFKVMLTSLGIIVGAATIVIVVAIGRGGQQDVADQFKYLNAGTITIANSTTVSNTGGGNMPMGGPPAQMGSNNGNGRSRGQLMMPMGDMMNRIKRVTLSQSDMDEIAYFIDNISTIALMATGSSDIMGGTLEDDLSATIVGATEDYLSICNLSLLQGQLFDGESNDALERVAILGYETAVSIFENVFDAYDSQININNKKYTVIGVLEKTGSVVSDITIDSAVFVPFNTAEKYIFGSNSFSPQIAVVVDDVNQIQDTQSAIQQLLLEIHPKSQFTVTDSGSQVVASQKSANTLSVLLIAVASIVFIVGGIGIMNVLFVSVKERTKEIGILKALGSSKKDILLQFLLEANIISLIGGIAGVAISYIIMPLIRYTGMTILPSASGALMALAFAVLTGTIFGFYPAWQAASLKPIDALNQD